MHLDSPRPIMDNEFALFGDGGYDVKHGASFSAQIRFFQSGPQYFLSTATFESPVSSRLPHRYGYEESTVHTAELSAMVASLRWCSPGAWNMFVGDRSSLFSALREAADPFALWPSRGACLPLEGRLRFIVRRIASSWTGVCNTPLWKENQEHYPEKLEVRIPLEADDKLKWMSKISFHQFGLIGVDVKSHQVNTAYPHPVITQGNDAQDTYCRTANARPRPPDILLPSGGPFAFLCKDGRMVTAIPNKFTRDLLRRQSIALMSTKRTQGKLAKFKGLIYPHTHWTFAPSPLALSLRISITFC